MRSCINLSIILALLFFYSQGNTQTVTKEQAELAFESLSPEERNTYLERAEVLNPKWISDVQATDVLKKYEETCHTIYERDIHGKPIIPKVSCEYKPAKPNDPLDGATPKFKCAFNFDGKVKTQKVKYFLGEVDQKELPQAIFLATLAKLAGFYANTYCPAIIECKGCPQDPWLTKSQEPAIPNSIQIYKNAVIEFKTKGDKLSLKRTVDDKKPLGFDWGEMKRGTREQLIAREALMVFLNLINHGDADPHNHRLLCKEWEEQNQRPICTEVIALTHDWGDAFKKMDFSDYSGHTPLSSWGCTGTLKIKDFYIGTRPKYSKEAVTLLVDRLDRVSNQQMIDLLELAQVRKTKKTPEMWVQLIRKKIELLRQLKCESIDSRKTALGKYLPR